jgi:TonB-linked SusC/RagA family outer membrane protein
MSLTGGARNIRYLTSVNYMDQKGVIKDNGTQRFSARLNLDTDLGKYVTAGITANFSQNRYDNVPLGQYENEYSGIIALAVQSSPANPVYNEDGTYFIDPNRSFVPNPVSVLDIADKSVKNRLLGNAYLSVKPVDGLELRAQLGADKRDQKRSIYMPKTTLEGQKHNGAATIMQQDATDYLLDITATYLKDFDGHFVKAMAGYAYQKYTTEGVSAEGRDFLTDSYLYHNLFASNSEMMKARSSASKRSIGSYFGRLHYNYKGRYMAEATLRVDGSSNFNPEYRWGYFPSVSAAWMITEESFMKTAKSWLSQLKLRASWGQTGNENVGYGLYDAYTIDWRNPVIGGEESKGAYLSTLGNPGITWETTTEINVGLDVGFIGDRITLTAEYFNRKITDMLQGAKPLPLHNEVRSIITNAGSVKSSGFELTINSTNIVRPDFKWETTLTLSHYNDRWVERPSFTDVKPYQKDNDPLTAWWAYESLGIMQPGETAPAAQLDLLPGMVKLKDRNNDDKIDDLDMVYQGTSAPQLVFGFNNSLVYRRFDFNVYFYGELGSTRGASYLENWMMMDKNTRNVSINAYKAFSSYNTKANAPTYLSKGTNYGWGNFYTRNINYLRCGSITLGYTIPVPKNIIGTLRVFANVNNPFVVTNWTGLDPETDTTGSSNGNFHYPNVRTWSFGLNLTF